MKGNKQMTVIRHPTCPKQGSTMIAEDSPKVVMQLLLDFFGNQGSPILSAENELVIQGRERLCHKSLQVDGLLSNYACVDWICEVVRGVLPL
jgi:hypothetical protein